MVKKSKILLVSDAPPSSSAGGISQTLANIFKLVDPDLLMILTSEEEIRRQGLDTIYSKNTVTFKREYLPFLKNRIGLYVNKYIDKFLCACLQLFALRSGSQIKSWQPDLIVICPNTVSGVIVGAKIAKELKIPFYIYLMDDWFANESNSWIFGDLQSQMDFLLRKSKGWIMISEYLAEMLHTRFNIHQTNIHILHNPVTPWQNEVDIQLPPNKIKVAYAGALWDMHFDAFLAFSKALFLINERGGDAELLFFGKEQFWFMRKPKLEGLPVRYAGFLKYGELNKTLYNAHYLLVCSSFDERYAQFSKSSVQTKITDYMNVGRPIISIGPEFGACNKFIEENELGFCIQSNEEEKNAEKLNFIFQSIEMQAEYVANGKKLIEAKYNSENVLKALLHFLD